MTVVSKMRIVVEVEVQAVVVEAVAVVEAVEAEAVVGVSKSTKE